MKTDAHEISGYVCCIKVAVHRPSNVVNLTSYSITVSITVSLFIRPPVRSNGRSYKMLVMFFLSFFFFSPTVLRAPSTDRPETLPPDRNLRLFYNASPKIKGPSPQKNSGAKNMQNFGRFWTTSDCDRESPKRANISKIGKRYKL